MNATAAWVAVVIAGVGIVGQWGVGAFWAGKFAQRSEDHDRRLGVVEEAQGGLTKTVGDHGERIARLEGGHKQHGHA